jgi:hypothetical protein
VLHELTPRTQGKTLTRESVYHRNLLTLRRSALRESWLTHYDSAAIAQLIQNKGESSARKIALSSLLIANARN